MVVLLTVFACNLLGLFEIVLPWRVMDAAGRAGGGRSLWGPFGTGVFATLLATPCSAPFLGTAIGFALTQDDATTLAMFAALGLGFAAPYLLVAAFPALAQLLPRPGRWMIVLKAVLAVALLATALWLVTVLSVQIGVEGAVAIGVLMAILALLFWLRRRLPRALAAPVLAGMAIVLTGAFAAPEVLDRPGSEPAASAEWVAFDEAAIRTRVAAGEVVFVDVTAEWCLTCKVNEALVLTTPAIVEALAGTAAMRGDWTSPDPAIADFLAAHGRYGIPFNIVYGPAAPAGIILPELLTEDSVLDAIARAGGTV
jgi:suppressor for copper-sensitivity B